MSTATTHTSESEISILARVFDDERGLLPLELARSIMDVEFSERDKTRMHDLAVRNRRMPLHPRKRKSCTRSPRPARSSGSSNPKPGGR